MPSFSHSRLKVMLLSQVSHLKTAFHSNSSHCMDLPQHKTDMDKPSFFNKGLSLKHFLHFSHLNTKSSIFNLVQQDIFKKRDLPNNMTPSFLGYCPDTFTDSYEVLGFLKDLAYFCLPVQVCTNLVWVFSFYNLVKAR